ncbi:MAG: hypothetical protein O4861_14225 [Trichodesmium sp. St16_bin4-tuft]|nr:hypothetical protein [Trichodesmium sp. ALOHA_ZT_67]MDE5070665.1 hypothetical protein [Trichodesmium sp. St5_bin8]MDE5090901.1 hypothetical protein [Trichodesmium sp. St18_bin3_1_1]MDE5099418.1 hypothetical protein [Trichodesmium sp. St16_bin4-tuft]
MSNSLNDRFVERTYGRLNRFRRLSKDYEVYSDVSKAMIYGPLIQLTLKRLDNLRFTL